MTEMNVTPPPPLPSEPRSDGAPLPVMSYATMAPSNQPARLSFIFGLLFFVPLAVPGIVAIVFGRRGVRVAKKEGGGGIRLARAGIILGVVNLLLTLAMVVSMPMALARARRQTLAVHCMANLRQIGMGTMLYANANKGFMPPTIDHIAATVPGMGLKRAFTCPACGTNPAKAPVTVSATVSSNYYYGPPAARLSQIRPASTTVIAYEPPSNHDNRSMALLFADGHVELITGPAMLKIAAELAAGQNPPPSKK